MELLELFSKLVAFDTSSEKSNLDAVDFLADYLVNKGFRIELVRNDDEDKANLIAEIGPYGDGLMLCGHLDTLPPGQGWTKPPFELTREDGRFYGRGTTDMKCFIAQVVKAAEEFAESELKKRMMLAFTYEEEVGCHGAKKLVGFWDEQNAPKPEFALIGEPTSFRVCRMHKGYSRLRLLFRGIPGHSSRPDCAVSAIEYATRAVEGIGRLRKTLEEKTHETASYFKEYPYTSIGAGTIKGGEATNQVPGRCEISLDYRSMPGESTRELLGTITQMVREGLEPAMVDEAKRKGLDESLVGIDILEDSFAEPMHTPEGTELEKLLLELSPWPEVGATFYYTDGGIFSRHGVSSLIFGPGSIDQAHKPDEFITEEQFVAGVPLLKKVIEKYCS